jgi:hypothetical protein
MALVLAFGRGCRGVPFPSAAEVCDLAFLERRTTVMRWRPMSRASQRGRLRSLAESSNCSKTAAARLRLLPIINSGESRLPNKLS